MKKRLLSLVIVLSLFLLPIIAKPVVLPNHTSENNYVLADDWNQVGSNVTFGFETPSWNQVGSNVTFEYETFPYGGAEPIVPISGFEQTIDGDILHYPDAIMDLELFASADELESGSYSDTYAVDASSAEIIDIGDYLEFQTVARGQTNLSYYIYLASIGSAFVDIRFYNWDTSTYDVVDENIGTTAGWYNASISGEDYISSTYVIRMTVCQSAYPASVMVDMAYLDLEIMTLADSNHYAESFADVSDWTVTGTGSPSINSDGDLGNFTATASGSQIYPKLQIDNLAITCSGSYYFSAWIEANVAIWTTITLYNETSFGGTSQELYSMNIGGYEVYLHKLITLNQVQGIKIQMSWSAALTKSQFWDYIRIAPANETGWGHDGSTTSGLEATNGASIASDGDILTITNDEASQIVLYIDPTTTEASLYTAYYPFLELNFDSASDGLDFSLQYYDSSYTTFQTRTTITSPYVYRYNLNAECNSFSRLRLWGFDSDVVKLDNILCFGIANFTYTQSGCGTDDYLYTENGILYSNIDSGEIVLDLDSGISVDNPYRDWSINSTLGNPEASVYADDWSEYSYGPETVLGNTTITDVRFRFSDNVELISLIFFDNYYWNDITPSVEFSFRVKSWLQILVAVVLRFYSAIQTAGLEAVFVLIGLILIPCSTAYLAYCLSKDRRSDMSVDKFLVFLLVFMAGWALFIGGII